MSDDVQQNVPSLVDDCQNALPPVKPLTLDLLLVIFIHGFKGTDFTFGGFPDRLQHVLSETIEDVIVECILFPVYETKGELKAAVERFADWLVTLTVEREVSQATSGNVGKTKIVLCGHSMGGLLAADALLEIANSRPDSRAPLWPRIIACITFDTPYLGIHPHVFKNRATKAVEYAQTARTVATGVFGSFAAYGAKKSTEPATSGNPIGAPPTNKTSGGWGKWAPAAYMVGGALVAGAAAGTAYYKREDLGMGYTWITDHMKFVGNLWDQDVLKKRMNDMVVAEEQLGVAFRVFYPILPPTPPTHRSSRTFIVLPPSSANSSRHFWPVNNRLAPDEIQAHMGMFDVQTNDGFYEMGLQTAIMIRDAVMMGRGLVQDDEKKVAQTQAAGNAMNDTLNATSAKGAELVSESLIQL